MEATIQREDAESKWLKQQKVKTDHLQGALKTRCDAIHNLVKSVEDTGSMPHTVALFGSWGCGKTALLAELNHVLRQDKDRTVIYFNAYKHAAFMEVMPALVYRLIQSAPDKEQNARDLALSIACNLVAQNAKNLGQWVQQRVGVDPYELYKSLDDGMSQYKAAVSKTEGARLAAESRKLLEQYYTQVDRAQNALEKCFAPYLEQNPKKAIVILVDELDRCDPGEAFDVMKQLRVLFSMRNLPFLFVLAANPDPIGQAIQHKYGLDRDDYESRRILEKFVDTCVDLSDAVRLRTFIETNWASLVPSRTLASASTLIGLDSLVNHEAPPNQSTGRILHTMLNDVDSAHFLYGNLRLLTKSMTLANSYVTLDNQIWTIWHLILVKQLRPTFRHQISRVAESLKLATESGYVEAVRRCGENNLIDSQGKFKSSQSEGFAIGNPSTPFRSYYDKFWETLKAERTKYSQKPSQTERTEVLTSLLNDRLKVDFLANMCAISLGEFDELRVADPKAFKLEDQFGAGYSSQRFRDLGWLLANF